MPAALQGSKPLLLEVSLARAPTACKLERHGVALGSLPHSSNMAKSVDPVQAARKAAVKREAKRNRERKERAQEARTLRQDTSGLERQIQRLESRTTLDSDDQDELTRLQAEVANVKRIKENYIRKHPDQRNFVRGFEDGNDAAGPSSSRASTSHTASAHPHTQGASSSTTARDPKWSIYYDPIFNPYGAPPPGMLYLEKSHAQLIAEGLLDAAKPPPLPEETSDFSGSDQDSDDSSVDEDMKDIVLPNGPPPLRYDLGHKPAHGASTSNTGRKRGDFGTQRGRGQDYNRSQYGGRGSSQPHHQQGARQRANYHQGTATRYKHNTSNLPPRPASAVTAGQVSHPSSSVQPAGSARPPGPPPAVPDGVIISAEPQLRDFKKESTAFVPAALRKKQLEEKARVKRGLPGRIDAAPISQDMTSSTSASHQDKPDLLRSVQAHLPPKQARPAQKDGSKTEYDQFLNEVSDLLQ